MRIWTVAGQKVAKLHEDHSPEQKEFRVWGITPTV